MPTITSVQKLILEKLIFPEPFERILEETGLHTGTLRDELINLLSYGYVEAHETSNGREQDIDFYDTDNLQLFSFRATKQGLKFI